MTSIDIHPYYHPTTVVVVDDSRNFLVGFSLSLDEKLTCCLYDSPKAALAEMNAASSIPAPAIAINSLFDSQASIADQGQQNGGIDLLVEKAANPARFLEKSVLIVDYDMPEFNGVDFCKLIQNKSIKKIMISGVADEKIAVKAFNDGVINKFILKSDSDESDLINDYIFKLQNEYFVAKTALFKSLLSEYTYSFLLHPVFAGVFQRLCKEYNIVEYYLASKPCGFTLFSESGKAYSLVVYLDEEFDNHADVIKDQEGPAELHNLTKQRKVIPFFDTQDGYYVCDIEDYWRHFIYPAQRLHAELPFYYALISYPTHLGSLTQNFFSYSQHLETVDKALKRFS